MAEGKHWAGALAQAFVVAGDGSCKTAPERRASLLALRQHFWRAGPLVPRPARERMLADKVAPFSARTCLARRCRHAYRAPTAVRRHACHRGCWQLAIRVMTVWPSGLRRWLQAPVRKGVGSNPTAVNGRGLAASASGDTHGAVRQTALQAIDFLCTDTHIHIHQHIHK